MEHCPPSGRSLRYVCVEVRPDQRLLCLQVCQIQVFLDLTSLVLARKRESETEQTVRLYEALLHASDKVAFLIWFLDASSFVFQRTPTFHNMFFNDLLTFRVLLECLIPSGSVLLFLCRLMIIWRWIDFTHSASESTWSLVIYWCVGKVWNQDVRAPIKRRRRCIYEGSSRHTATKTSRIFEEPSLMKESTHVAKLIIGSSNTRD